MDDGEFAGRSNAGQGVPRVLRRRDGGWAVAFEENNVVRIGKLVVVFERTALDEFEDRLESSLAALKRAIGLRDFTELEAFARCDYEVARALEALTEAMRS
jgi:hypothetical protein